MLKKKVIEFIREHNLIQEGSKLVVGVSGGPDSLALLHFLKQLQQEWNIALIAAHMDHMFRGEESYQDYLFVEAICKDWGILFEGTRADVPAYIEKTGASPQVAARTLRFQFFESVMHKYRATELVLGHHGDDQIETMLMRLSRGATGTARAGIQAKRSFASGKMIRPFLGVTKEQILTYASENGLQPRHDPSNDKNDYVRNRFRHEVVPFLKEENPLVHEHFQRFSEELFEDEGFLQQLAREKMEQVWVERSKDRVIVHIDAVLNMPKPLQKRVLQLILNYLYSTKPSSLSALHIKQLVSLFLLQKPSAELNLPEGLIAEKSYQHCIFYFKKRKNIEYAMPLELPGETFLPNGYKVKAQYLENVVPVGGNDVIVISPADVVLPLWVRTRKKGDRMSVKGLNGTKKIKDIFINEKIPKFERDSWPIITDQNDQILWLPNLKKSYIETDCQSKEPRLLYLQYIKA